METIYWIQRLGEINFIANVFFVLSIIFGACFAILAMTNYEDRNDYDENAMFYNIGIRGFKTAVVTFFISMFLSIFVPSENNLYVIYGVGGTIDYIKSNDTAKQLPDKVVNALDAWIDNQTNNK